MIGPRDFEGGPVVAFDGDLPSAEKIQHMMGNGAQCIAADGAARTLRAIGVRPDVIIGDLDGIGDEREHAFFSESTFIEDGSQDEYDGAKAITYAINAGAETVTVIGASGGRVDHILNNYSILARFARRVRIRAAGTIETGYIVHEPFELNVNAGDRISLNPLPEARLTTEGLQWNLYHETIRFGERGGCSNRAMDGTVRINSIDGLALVVHYG